MMNLAGSCKTWRCHQKTGAQERRVANGAGRKTIYVYENWRGEAPTLLGRLRCGFVRGQETFSFEYDPAWLSSAESSFSLDPDLPSTVGGSMCR